MRCLLPSLLLLSIVPSEDLLAQSSLSWSTEVAVNAMGEGYFRPRIVLNAAGHPVILWYGSNPAMNHVSVSDGTSFSAPIMIHPMGFAPAGADWMGSDLHAVGNAIWAVMKGTPEHMMGMYLVRSDDGGYTWGDTVRIDPPGDWARFPSVGSNAQDEPVIQYMQFDSNFLEPRHVVARSVAGVFQTPVQVSTPFANGEACDCCPAQVVTGGDDVVALYRNNEGNLRAIYGASSQDGAASFLDGNMLDGTGWTINACPSSGPDGYIAGDSIRYVWMSGATGYSRVYRGSASVNGLGAAPFSQMHPLTQTNLQQNFPRIAGSGDTLGVVWQQSQAGQFNVLFSYSTTGIAGLSDPDTVNTATLGQGRVPDITYRDGVFHFAWTHMQGGVVKYRAATVTNAQGITDARAEEGVAVWPNPVHDVLHISGTSTANVEILDAEGRIAFRATANASVDVRALPAGRYVCKVGARSIPFLKN